MCNKEVHTFHKVISSKVIIITSLEFELAFYDVAVQYVNNYSTGTSLVQFWLHTLDVAGLVAWHISARLSDSCQTRVNTSPLTLATAVEIHCLRSSKLTGMKWQMPLFWRIHVRKHCKLLNGEMKVVNSWVTCCWLFSYQLDAGDELHKATAISTVPAHLLLILSIEYTDCVPYGGVRLPPKRNVMSMKPS